MTRRHDDPRRSRRKHGQALVEFAMVAPIFFLLLLGTIEAGRFIYHAEMLNNAARDGTRYAIIHGANASCATGGPTGPLPPSRPASPCSDPTGNDVREAVRAASFALVGTGDLTIPNPVYSPVGSECGVGGGNNTRGNSVLVSVSYTYPPLVPVLPSISISAESCLVVNN